MLSPTAVEIGNGSAKRHADEMGENGEMASKKSYGANHERWTTHSATEEYVNAVGQLMCNPNLKINQYGYNPEQGRYPFERVSALGILLCPLRKASVFEKWSPFEVAVFEASITLFGKNFHRISKYVKSKSTKEVIEFYYDWKKTQHYKDWKKTYIPDDREIPSLVGADK